MVHRDSPSELLRDGRVRAGSLKAINIQLQAEVGDLEARLQRREADLDALRSRILRVAAGSVTVCEECLREVPRPAA